MTAVIILCLLNLAVSAGIFYFVLKPRTVVVDTPKEEKTSKPSVDEQLNNLLTYSGGGRQ